MTCKEFIESEKIWEIIEEINKIESTFKKEGYCNLPGLNELFSAMQELILLRDYQAEDLEKIATEAAVSQLGMKKLNKLK
jgi:hypothetical protein